MDLYERLKERRAAPPDELRDFLLHCAFLEESRRPLDELRSLYPFLQSG